MKKQNYKGVSCTKRKLSKCIGVCKTYGELETQYADMLEDIDEVKEFETCVPLGNEYVTDFVIRKVDGTIAVRECVARDLLLKPRMAKLLDISLEHWCSQGVSDWKIVTNEKE